MEYVDNGTKPDGPETPEQQVFKAMHSNPEEAKYVNDKFTFEATLNGVDVTSTTKFRVNGVDIPGNTYVPFKEGSHSVLASMDDFTASFKFTVLEEDTTPEPTGNRIEYGGNSYPVSEVLWLVHAENNQIKPYNRNGVTCTVWAMLAIELDSNDEVINQFLTFTYVPIKANGKLAFPNNTPGPFEHLNGGVVTINGNDVFDTANVVYNFAGTGNTSPADDSPSPWTGTANFTGLATGTGSGNSAELFWNGTWNGGGRNLLAKAKMGNILNGFDVKQIKNFKTIESATTLELKK
ncbi:hypothetical protein [Paenimyroides aestuarii]|uniref:Uncharacterized protein n=1 Tax=Paenimyroides aestuarii TaxID=2968490 RepID=A0ABY5NTZ8_9FLAO|nr:hypothetical protein [Paenimyroides aestuarii]UUV22031.1 hypothetical protein NPX36_03020 [Paenimyroides aestuarii]